MRPLRVLVETSDPALSISDFRYLVDAGFAIARCGGPGDDPMACPLLRDERCRLVDEADVVLHELDPALGIDGAIRSSRPDVPLLVQRRCDADGAAIVEVPEGAAVVVFPCSVGAQVDAIREAVRRR